MRALLPEQMTMLEEQLKRQEEAMAARMTRVGTRATVLIGASAVLGGAELVTVTGFEYLSAASLVLYLAAAISGIIASRSTIGKEPDLPRLIRRFGPNAPIAMRRDLIYSRLISHETAVHQLLVRHRWLVSGVVLLAIAWVSTAVGTLLGVYLPSETNPTEIRIVE